MLRGLYDEESPYVTKSFVTVRFAQLQSSLLSWNRVFFFHLLNFFTRSSTFFCIYLRFENQNTAYKMNTVELMRIFCL